MVEEEEEERTRARAVEMLPRGASRGITRLHTLTQTEKKHTQKGKKESEEGEPLSRFWHFPASKAVACT